MKNSKSLFKTIVMVIFLSVFSKLFGLFRDIMIGAKFGTGIESDVYFTSLKSTTILFMSVGVAITTNMIPIIVGYITNNQKNKAIRFSNKIITFLFFLSILISIFGYLLLPFYLKIIANGFDTYKFELTLKVSRIIFPSIIFIFIAYAFNSMLQAYGKFEVTSLMSLPYNLILILYMIFFSNKFGIIGLAVCTTVGWFLQAFYQFPSIKKQGYKIRFDIKIFDKDVEKFLSLMFPLLVSSTVSNINSLIDTSIATNLTDGKLSALNYGNTTYMAISQTLIYGISTVLYPQFSKMITECSNKDFRKKLSQILKMLIIIILPLTAVFISLSFPIVQFVFKRGVFTDKSVQYTSISLSFYIMGMLAFGMQDILSKVFFAYKDTKTAMKFSIISIFINIILNLIFVRFLDFAGLAIATTIATSINAIMLYFALNFKIGKIYPLTLLKTLLKMLVISSVIGVLGYNAYSFIFKFVDGKFFELRGLSLDIFFTLCLSFLLQVLAFIILCKILRVKEVNDIISKFILKIKSK